MVSSRAEPACHIGRAPSDAPSQRLGTDVVAGAGDALNTQDDVRRDDPEHNDLSHVHNLTHRALSGYVRGHAQTQVAIRDGLLVRVGPRPAEFTAGNSPRDMAKVPPCQLRLDPVRGMTGRLRGDAWRKCVGASASDALMGRLASGNLYLRGDGHATQGLPS